MIQSLLALDTSLLIRAQSLLTPEYALLIQLVGESVVIAGGLTLLSIWLIGVARGDNEYKKNALRIFMTIVGVFVIYSVVNLGLPQWRPGAMELSGATALIPHPTDNSFPSGHALFSAALLIGLYRYMRRGWLIALIAVLAILTTTARVIGGVHYVGDILGGFLFGGIGAIYLEKLVQGELMEKYVYPVCIRIASWIKL